MLLLLIAIVVVIAVIVIVIIAVVVIANFQLLIIIYGARNTRTASTRCWSMQYVVCSCRPRCTREDCRTLKQ